ncbi:MAG: glycosyl hydrolase [Chthoniobacteraceae bacterium]
MNRRLKVPLIALLLAIFASRLLATDSIMLGQAQLGNVFLSTETVQIPLQTTGDQVSWTVKDFFGFQTSGPVTPVPGNGQVTIAPGQGRLGFFELHVTALRNGIQVAFADTTFAVVAPSNVSTMHDSPFGVMTHFAHGWTTEIMQLLARGGIAHFRDEQYWQNVEPTPGKYTFGNFDAYMTTAATLGLNPLVVLDFANSNYDSGYSPYTAGGRAGYANYCQAVVSQYNPQIDTVEIWNEYNGSFFSNPVTNPPPDRASLYTEMLSTAYTAIKAVRPGVRVVGGACVPVPLPWFQSLFALGAQNYMDVLDVHPYRSIPEGVESDIAALQALSATYNNGQPKPIWATECGAPDTVNPGRQDMARYLVRLMTLMRSAGVERAYWYLAYDYDGYATGLVRSPTDPLGPYVPSSAFPAYANLIQQLYRTTYVGRDNTDARTRMHLFRRGTSDVRVVWSSAGTAQLVLTTNTPLTRIDIMGVSTVLQPTNGAIALTADATPFYLIGPISSVREFGRDAIVADSVRDFSNIQGSTNGTWSYGNAVIFTNSPYNPASVTPLTFTSTSYGFEYSMGFPFGKLDANGGHPGLRQGYGPPDLPVWLVRRWLSDVVGTVHFHGTIVRAAATGGAFGGDGTGAKILVDGNEVYSALLGSPAGGTTVSFDFYAPIQVGAKVDFAITPGPGNELNSDYVDFRAQISVPPSAPTTFAAWQQQHFTAAEFINPAISADVATPAGDGVQNLLKYSANLGPKASGLGAVPTVGMQTVGSDRYLTLSYRKATAPTDLAFTTQLNDASLSPGTWTTGGVQLGSPVLNGDGTQTFTIRDEVPFSLSPLVKGRFMRLRVGPP